MLSDELFRQFAFIHQRMIVQGLEGNPIQSREIGGHADIHEQHFIDVLIYFGDQRHAGTVAVNDLVAYPRFDKQVDYGFHFSGFVLFCQVTVLSLLPDNSWYLAKYFLHQRQIALLGIFGKIILIRLDNGTMNRRDFLQRILVYKGVHGFRHPADEQIFALPVEQFVMGSFGYGCFGRKFRKVWVQPGFDGR